METNADITNANTIKKSTDYTVRMIPMEEIFADPEFNCRGYIAPIDVAELAKDIKANGLQIPIVVQPYVCDNQSVKYRVVAGHRRHKAFLVNEDKQIPAFIRNGLDEISARILNFSENIARKALNLGEEANVIKKLKDLGLTQDETAQRLNVHRSWIQTRFNLLELPEEVQKEIIVGALPLTVIKDCYTIKRRNGSKEEMYALVKKYKDAKLSGGRAVLRVGGQKSSPAKRLRNKAEIFHLQDIIRKSFGNGLTTRALAWCAGEVDDARLLYTIEEIAIASNVQFVRPMDNCVSSIIVEE